MVWGRALALESQMIPVAIPDLSGNEDRYVQEAIKSTWVSSSGAFLDRFETEFAEKCRTDHALAVSNGTVALHLALLALDVQPGDEVIVPSLTYIATANAVRYMGAVPIFADVEPGTWCLDAAQAETLITPRTKGIIAVHIYGHPADMDAINAVAKRHGLWVVEDAAEAHFAEYKGRPVGGMSDIATFSFFGNKVFTCGEGGAVTLNDDRVADKARLLRSQGMDPNRRYSHPVVGYNYRLTNVAAAMLCAQLERADAIIARRNEIFARYEARLANVPGLAFQPVAEWAKRTPWLFSMTVEDGFGATRDELADHLKAGGVDTRPFFLGLHQQEPYLEFYAEQKTDLPVSERLTKTGINLPTYVGLTDDQVDQIADLIRAKAGV